MSVDQPAPPNIQEHQRLLAALRESEILRELAELLTSSLDLNYILQVLVKRTTEVCQIERCAVWLLDDTQSILRPATYHLSSQQLNSHIIMAADHIWYHSSLPFADPVVHRLFNENGLLFLEDLATEPGMRSVGETFLVRSILLIALVREGRPVGMLTLDEPGKIRTFSPEQIQLARAIGYQVAIAANSGEDLTTVLEIANNHLIRKLNADGGLIALLDNETLRLAISSMQLEESSTTQITATLSKLPNCYHAAQQGKPLFVTAEHAEGEEITWFHNLGLVNAMLVPLMVGITPNNSLTNQSTTQVPITRCVGLAFVNYHKPDVNPSKGQFAFGQIFPLNVPSPVIKFAFFTIVTRPQNWP